MQNLPAAIFGIAGIFLSMAPMVSAAPVEKLRNDKVIAHEQNLAPGEAMPLSATHAGMLVYFEAGVIEVAPTGGAPKQEKVKRGDVVFRAPQAGTLKNAGLEPLHVVWIEYLGQGNEEVWGTNGLATNYTLLVENRYGRAYDIRIRAGAIEPKHTHHDRVVICLTGAKLEHTLLDGTKEPATLQTGEITWRRGVTHSGHNLGKTDLWVIAIEPK